MKHEKAKTQKLRNDLEDNLNFKPSPRQTFTIEWDNVFRIIGSITGLTGISAALLWIFGFAEHGGSLDSMGLTNNLYFSIPNEQYLLLGTIFFIKFISDIGAVFIIYFVANTVTEVFRKNILNRLLLFSIIGVIAFIYGIYLIIQEYEFGNAAGFAVYFKFFQSFMGFEILLIILEEFHSNKNKQQPLARLYSLFYSNLWVIKVLAIALIIFGLFVGRSLEASSVGRSLGCEEITNSPTSITMYSDNSILIDGETKIEELYIYKGYYFLFSDNENYYLFRELNPDTLQPKRIMSIKKDSVKVVEFEKATAPPDWNLVKTCPSR